MLSKARDMGVPDSLQTHAILTSVRWFKILQNLKINHCLEHLNFELSMIRHVDFVQSL